MISNYLSSMLNVAVWQSHWSKLEVAIKKSFQCQELHNMSCEATNRTLLYSYHSGMLLCQLPHKLSV